MTLVRGNDDVPEEVPEVLGEELVEVEDFLLSGFVEESGGIELRESDLIRLLLLDFGEEVLEDLVDGFEDRLLDLLLDDREIALDFLQHYIFKLDSLLY